jgi:hypothetical protein
MNDMNAPITSSGTQALENQRLLQTEREWTAEDARFTIASVPDRPDVKADARVIFEELQFRGRRTGRNRVWLNGMIEAERLTPDPLPDGRFRYRVDAYWTILDEAREYVRREGRFEATVPRVLKKNESLQVRLAADLPPGRYRYTAVVMDAGAPDEAGSPSGNFRTADMTVREFGGRTPALSDVAVAADSGGSCPPPQASRCVRRRSTRREATGSLSSTSRRTTSPPAEAIRPGSAWSRRRRGSRSSSLSTATCRTGATWRGGSSAWNCTTRAPARTP